MFFLYPELPATGESKENQGLVSPPPGPIKIQSRFNFPPPHTHCITLRTPDTTQKMFYLRRYTRTQLNQTLIGIYKGDASRESIVESGFFATSPLPAAEIIHKSKRCRLLLPPRQGISGFLPPPLWSHHILPLGLDSLAGTT